MGSYNTPEEWLSKLESQSAPQQRNLSGLIIRYGLASDQRTAQYILGGAGLVVALVSWFTWHFLYPAQNVWSAETRLEMQDDLERMRNPPR
jgi:hypothetical protein